MDGQWMRRALIRRGPVAILGLCVALWGGVLGSAWGSPSPELRLLRAGMAGSHSFQVTLALSGLEGTDLILTARFGESPVQVDIPLVRLPSPLSVVLDLQRGDALIGGVTVAHFPPVPRFTENLRVPIVATADAHGSVVARADGTAFVLLPTVIVPGYLNEVGGPDEALLRTLRQRGYATQGPYPTAFWFAYPSRRVTLPEGARKLRAFVRSRVVASTYANAINVVGYSSGGLFARWNLAYDLDGWGTLVDRLVLVGVPNEGAVIAYLGAHAPSFLALGGLGHTVLARAMFPTFPFWRPTPHDPWQTPPDGSNTLLQDLNNQPLPVGVRVYVFYGNHDPADPAGPLTIAGVTGSPTTGVLEYGPGDGIVLTQSARGLPIHGNAGVPLLTSHVVTSVDLGSVYHLHLLAAGARRIADVLLDRVQGP